jgi:hypothetical protein
MHAMYLGVCGGHSFRLRAATPVAVAFADDGNAPTIEFGHAMPCTCDTNTKASCLLPSTYHTNPMRRRVTAVDR